MEKLSVKNLLKSGIYLAYRNWRQMAMYTLIIWGINTILLAPPTSWLLKKLGSHGGDVIVGNYGMTNWLLSPQGIAYLLLAGSVILLSLILYMVGLFWIANASIDKTVLTTRQSITQVLIAIPRLLRYSLYTFLVCLLLSLVVGIGLGAIYLLLLSNHDINYYKTIHPPEWHWALILCGTWIISWSIAVGCLILRCFFVLPVWLEGSHSVRQAFDVSWKKTQGMLKSLVYVLGFFLILWMLACFVLEGSLFMITSLVLTHLVSSINGILYVVSVNLVISVLLDTILIIIGLAWFTCICTVCYRRVTDSEYLQVSAPDLSLKQLRSTAFWLKIFRLRVIFPLIAILLITSGFVSVWMFRQAPENFAAPLVFAHHAGAADAPENTLAAMKKAIKDGVSDYIEIDVQMTLDNIVVVAHDKDLMKAANEPRIIRETNYADFRNVDIGVMFGSEFKGQRLRELSDFLKAGKGKAKLMIEFKESQDTDLIGETIRQIREYGMQDDVVLVSLDLDDVRQAQHLTSRIPIGYFALTETGDLTQLDVDFIGLQDRMITPELVQEIKEHHFDVYGWTVDEIERTVELIEMGIDGIITNDPPTVARIIKKYQALSPAQHTLLRFRRFWYVFKKMGLWKTQPSGQT